MKNLMFCLTGLSKTIFMFQNEIKHITVNQRVDEEKKVKSWTTNTDKHILPVCSHAATQCRLVEPVFSSLIAITSLFY